MIVTSDVAQSIVGMNIIGPRRLVMDPVTCTVDFRDEGTAAALGVLGQREDGTIGDVRVLKATTIPGRHGQLLKLGLFNAERHRVHASVPTLVDMDIMAAAVNTDAMGGFSMHIPNADYEDREIKRGTLIGKAHKLSDWIPIDANTAINMTKKPERVLREHTKDELEVLRKLITYRQRQSDSTAPELERVHCNADGSATLLQCGQSGYRIHGSGAARNRPQGQGSGIQHAILIAS
jgi:hypothetical protein